MIKACIFDLDGVIVDTAKYHYIAWKDLAAKLDFEFTEEHNERLKGVSRMRSLDILLEIAGIKDLSEEEKLAMATQKNELYVSYIKKMGVDEMLPGVEQLLRELRSAGVKIALGSASKNAALILERLQLRSWFDVVVDGTHVSAAKPDPEVFLKGCEALGVLPEETVVFEDAEAGVEAALRGGMKCIGIGSREQLGKANVVVSGLDGFKLDQVFALCRD